MKIFVSAYACEPGLGSEIGVGWHWVLEMSRYFDLWVLTRESNRYIIESWIAAHSGYGHIHFLYYDWPEWARFWKKGLRGVRIYYNIWQYCTNRIVKHTMQKNDIKIFHHLTYGNVLWKVSSYGEKQFFIWGPVGGLETIPVEYSCHYDCKSRWIECLRRFIVKIIKWNQGFERRCRNADLILCKTDITQQAIPKEYRNKAVLFTDVAVEDNLLNASPIVNDVSTTEYLVVGRLDAWRGFDLVIEAMAKVIGKNPAIHLTIVGDGPDRKRIERLIHVYQLEAYVTMVGNVSMTQYRLLMSRTNVVINAALKEGAVTVSFDSMTMGKPLICLDTTGYTRYFSNDYAVVIPISSREKTIWNLHLAILRLTNKKIRFTMGMEAKRVGEHFSWRIRGHEFNELLSKRLKSER